MLILTLRTDKPEAEIGLFEGSDKLAYSTWQAHRQLAETIHLKIRELLESQNRSLDELSGVVIYKGPGSFTGLRIGISVANALAYSLNVPIIAETGDDWLQKGSQAISQGKNQQIALPEYGSPPHITLPN
ncbi:MAG TPA: tRNA (adenosine(37)-N6)-threonylcarbamoyltransferase complex dimerization subunit type 1 TsaB [Candidatus Dormibacteraeota bacterium]|nr:tRNA (adenosine(37)-N6)-threonylcarbamoyltransferase complex dimerization subunit type 1 TsaB [Candidatus Dormibacteraeota bacterium]